MLYYKIFKGFYYIWAWQPSYLMDHDHLYKFSIPPLNLRLRMKKFGPGVSEEKLFKDVDGQTDGQIMDRE